jgi:hypothetical protein
MKSTASPSTALVPTSSSVASIQTDDEQLQHDLSQLTGGEHFLVGLSPQYWAHTPMLMDQFHRLALVGGIDCIRTSTKLLPVSKCTLLGVIVNVDRKSNGSVLYLVDDGTGMVDCLHWIDNDHYRLPSLSRSTEYPSNHLCVGQVVRIMGRIKVLAIGSVRDTMVVAGKTWEIRDAVRELHVSVIEDIQVRQDLRRMDLGPETLHWLQCMDFLKNCESDLSNDAAAPVVRNGTDVLSLLGPAISKGALARTDLPSADDAIGAWKVFGAGCQCDLPYKESLLYCHCQATIEPLDPHFVFRDSTLATLLELEAMSDGHCIFLYQAIIHNPALVTVANNVLPKDGSGSLRQLFVKTFAALRKDGLIHLVDENTDTYRLISRQRVLEPYLEKMDDKSIENILERKALLAEQPPFLHNVPKARLQYAKRCLQQRDHPPDSKVSLASILN